jgi:uncharacterized LabA/DUF88 family protein
MKFYMVIDGPNFISRLIDLGIQTNVIAKSLSLNVLYNDEIKQILRKEFGQLTCLGIEFICSNKSLGPQSKKLTKKELEHLLTRLSNENAVYINKISILGQSEKGVDVMVATRLIELSEISDIVCLISSDKDYIPVLEYLKRKGKYIVTMGFEGKHPIELKNLSYLYIDLTNYFMNTFPNVKEKFGSVPR